MEDNNCAGHRKNIRGEAAPQNTYYEMSESAGKFRKSM